MIRALLRLAEWLDKRFPPKVTVTEDDYRALQDRAFKTDKRVEFMQRTSADGIRALEERVLSCEKSIVAIKDAMVRGGAMRPQLDALRDRFIKGDWEGMTVPTEVKP